MNIERKTFEKPEKLCSLKAITQLFESGNVFYTTLFKVVWQITGTSLPFPAQVAFSVSKKGFRLAVTRNLIKRRMREAYRKNKSILYNHLLSENIQITFIVIMKGNEVRDYQAIEASMKDVINKLTLLSGEKKS